MRAKDHYEMREYSIDVLEDGKDLSFCPKERLYPIYPSKRGLNPSILGDIIARFVLPILVSQNLICKVIFYENISSLGMITTEIY